MKRSRCGASASPDTSCVWPLTISNVPSWAPEATPSAPRRRKSGRLLAGQPEDRNADGLQQLVRDAAVTHRGVVVGERGGEGEGRLPAGRVPHPRDPFLRNADPAQEQLDRGRLRSSAARAARSCAGVRLGGGQHRVGQVRRLVDGDAWDGTRAERRSRGSARAPPDDIPNRVAVPPAASMRARGHRSRGRPRSARADGSASSSELCPRPRRSYRTTVSRSRRAAPICRMGPAVAVAERAIDQDDGRAAPVELVREGGAVGGGDRAHGTPA